MTNVNKKLNNTKEVDEMKKIIKNVIKICIFISLASLPFISMTQLIGLDMFLDSFENPDYYICLQDKENSFGLGTNNGEYIIIQKSTHPEFDVETSDSVLYYDNDGDLACNKINAIDTVGAIERYYTTEGYGKTDQTIFEMQIVGKIIKVVDGNIWNSISIRIWETSINSLNLRALLTDN